MAEQITIEHLRAVVDYVSAQDAITNRECRVVTGLGYDSSIKMLGALCVVGILKMTGEGSGTKYIALRADKDDSNDIRLDHLAEVIDHVVKQGSITNLQCEKLTRLPSSCSVMILEALCKLSILRKSPGCSSQTLVMTIPQAPAPLRPGFHRKAFI